MHNAAKYPSQTPMTESTPALSWEPNDGLAATSFVGGAAYLREEGRRKAHGGKTIPLPPLRARRPG